MRALTFRGFLGSYVESLSGERTLALTRLAQLRRDEPRLTEPALLWAAASGQADRMCRLLEGHDDLRRECKLLAGLAADGTLEQALSAQDARLRPEYLKVWRSYLARRDAHLRDAGLKLEARKRALALAKAKKVTRYRMASDLGLNPGNLHAYLVQANPSKLSLDRAMELVRYLEAA